MLLDLDPALAAKQALAWCIGLFAYAALSEIDPSVWWSNRYVWLVLGLLAVSLTIPFGVRAGGARAWLELGTYHLQPSEFFKPILIIFLAGYLSAHRLGLKAAVRRYGISLPPWREAGPLLVVWLVGLLFLVLERDLGTGLIVFALCVVLTYLATDQSRYMIYGVSALAAGSLAAYVLYSHVQVRFSAWLNPAADPTGGGYQTIGGLLALHAGGLLGTGWGRGFAHTLVAGPTDYAPAALAEQLGWLGVLATFALAATLVLAIFARAAAQEAPEAVLTAAGIGLWLAWQAIVVSGGIVRLWPLTGVTFPFLSYGGSSLVASLCGLALVNALEGANRVRANEG